MVVGDLSYESYVAKHCFFKVNRPFEIIRSHVLEVHACSLDIDCVAGCIDPIAQGIDAGNRRASQTSIVDVIVGARG